MSNEELKVGTLFVSNEVLQQEDWLVKQAISAAIPLLNKYKGLDGLLKPSRIRKGDFSLVIAELKAEPIIVNFIGIPGKAKAPIVQELFVKT